MKVVGLAATHLRGGSWFNNQDNARSVYRNINHPANRNINIGCRVVCVVRPTPPSLFIGIHSIPGESGPSPFIRDQRLPGTPVEHAWPATAKR
jgi:hypothetical protein